MSTTDPVGASAVRMQPERHGASMSVSARRLVPFATPFLPRVIASYFHHISACLSSNAVLANRQACCALLATSRRRRRDKCPPSLVHTPAAQSVFRSRPRAAARDRTAAFARRLADARGPG